MTSKGELATGALLFLSATRSRTKRLHRVHCATVDVVSQYRQWQQQQQHVSCALSWQPLRARSLFLQFLFVVGAAATTAAAASNLDKDTRMCVRVVAVCVCVCGALDSAVISRCISRKSATKRTANIQFNFDVSHPCLPMNEIEKKRIVRERAQFGMEQKMWFRFAFGE